MRRVIYCPQILRWSAWLMKWLNCDKLGRGTGFIWEKNMCHVLEISGVLFRSYITNCNSDKFMVSSRNLGLSSVYEKKPTLFPSEALSLGLHIWDLCCVTASFWNTEEKQANEKVIFLLKHVSKMHIHCTSRKIWSKLQYLEVNIKPIIIKK